MNFKSKLNLEETSLITKILVPVDGSKPSEKALDYALEIAEKFSASILILNVFQRPPEYDYQPNMFFPVTTAGYPQEPMGNQPNAASFVNDLRKTHETILSNSAKRALKLKPDLKIYTELKDGKISSQILETATDGKFDLIVMGHRGDGAINEFFLGSSSERIAHQAKCAVLIVK
jgi:nucleotide-binding universal stress UspA family protein